MTSWHKLRHKALLLGVLWCLTAAGHAGDGDRVWLLVDTATAELKIMNGDRPVQVFEDIAIGRYGTTRNKHRGDNRTPLGRFRIVRVHHDSPFLLFLGLDYPDLARAERAHAAGTLNRKTLATIRDAHKNRQEPPQNTPLGGSIGIHGLGAGDPLVHRQFNWTNGCIAITNEQILRLAEQVELGTEVIIR